MQLLQFSVGMVMTNCYMIFNEATKEAALVDPGDQAAYLLEQCRLRGLTLKAILLTHGHFDHILAAPALREETHAPVYAACAVTTCPKKNGSSRGIPCFAKAMAGQTCRRPSRPRSAAPSAKSF